MCNEQLIPYLTIIKKIAKNTLMNTMMKMSCMLKVHII